MSEQEDAIAKKVKEIFDKVNETDETLNDLEELQILAGEGVEYVIHKKNAEDLKFIVPVLDLYQLKTFLTYSTKAIKSGMEYKTKLENAKSTAEKDMLSSESEIAAVDITTESISELCNVPKEILQKYLRTEHVLDIQALLAWGRMQGTEIFKKKSIPRGILKEMRKSIITTILKSNQTS
jgi:hypothetical protein